MNVSKLSNILKFVHFFSENLIDFFRNVLTTTTHYRPSREIDDTDRMRIPCECQDQLFCVLLKSSFLMRLRGMHVYLRGCRQGRELPGARKHHNSGQLCAVGAPGGACDAHNDPPKPGDGPTGRRWGAAVRYP